MVVLEEGSMLTTGHNQYLQPDYLSPLPSLDAKKSPLALLAQTCSQIGADSPTKPLLSSLDKPSKGSSAASNARSPPAAKLERTRGSPADGKSSSGASSLAFKPYETNVVSTKRSSSGEETSSRPGSKASSVHSASGHDSANNSASDMLETNNNHNNNNNNTNSSSHKKSGSRSTPQGRKSASPAQPSAASGGSPNSGNSERKTPASGGERDKSSASPRNSGASPIIRSGMEILSGHANPKDPASLQSVYKSGLGAFGASSLCCPPGLAENPAFRTPFGGASAFSHHHAAAAAALLGYSGSSAPASPGGNPYLSYARVKTPSGGETLVPVCKDPFCTGCQYSMHNAQMMMAAAAASGSPGGSCPSGCTQCDHQKYGLMALSSLGPMPPPPALAGYPPHLAAAAAAAAAASGGRSHVCSWMAGDSFCGKRFASADDLLQHLRTHTSPAGGAPSDPSATAALLAGQHSAHPLLSSTAALQRAAAAAAGSYPAPSLSPLSSRYHPYGKPPAGPPMPGSLAASPYSAFNALGPYYSPYALYGQRIGAAVHP